VPLQDKYEKVWEAINIQGVEHRFRQESSNNQLSKTPKFK